MPMPAKRHPGRAQPEPIGLESAGLTPSQSTGTTERAKSTFVLFCFLLLPTPPHPPHSFNNWFHGERQKSCVSSTHGVASAHVIGRRRFPHLALVSLDTIQLGTLI